MSNTVELLGHYGSDETIACSAWTSTSRELTDGKRERIGKLINMLPMIRIAAPETTKSKMRETSGTTASPNKVSHHVA